jgi:hypothetical protein
MIIILEITINRNSQVIYSKRINIYRYNKINNYSSRVKKIVLKYKIRIINQ